MSSWNIPGIKFALLFLTPVERKLAQQQIGISASFPPFPFWGLWSSLSSCCHFKVRNIEDFKALLNSVLGSSIFFLCFLSFISNRSNNNRKRHWNIKKNQILFYKNDATRDPVLPLALAEPAHLSLWGLICTAEETPELLLCANLEFCGSRLQNHFSCRNSPISCSLGFIYNSLSKSLTGLGAHLRGRWKGQ